MRERIRFIHEWEKGDLTMAGVCRKYGVSRPTGYKWIQRYLEFEGDLTALVDLPRTPHHHPWATDAQMVDLIIRARRQQPTWGPRKLRERLRRAYPQIDLPAPSTIGAILKRHGLSSARHGVDAHHLGPIRCRTARRRTACGARTSRVSSRLAMACTATR